MRIRPKVSDLRRQIEDLEDVQTRLNDHIQGLCAKVEQQDRREQSYRNLEKQYEAAKISLDAIDTILQQFPSHMLIGNSYMANMRRSEAFPPNVQLAHILGFVHAQEHRAHEDRVTVSTTKIPGHFVGLDQES